MIRYMLGRGNKKGDEKIRGGVHVWGKTEKERQIGERRMEQQKRGGDRQKKGEAISQT